MTMNATRQRNFDGKALVLLLGLVATMLTVVKYEMSYPLLYRTIRGNIDKIDTDVTGRVRALSLNLGGGRCKWQPPRYNVPDDIDFHKTLVAGYPSGDKRMIYIQMEALSGWPAKDEWDFEFTGITNHPFIKANYPHHEGIWGYGEVVDQTVLMVRNIRLTMVEYHDILWDIGYAKTWEEATARIAELYSTRPPIEDFYEWRDNEVMHEIHWYGWFIDFWMENGLFRDIFTHKITTPEHFYMLRMPTVYTHAELDYDVVVGADTVVTPSYDPHCTTDVTGSCEPVAVISAEKLRDYTEGPAETAFIANVLHNDDRTGKYVIAEEAYDCIWEELIRNGKGLKTVLDRPHSSESENFSAEMLEEMLLELDRVITKYSGPDWSAKSTANRLVELLAEHRDLVQIELNQVNAGWRKLSDKDFLGPKERERRRRLKLQESNETEYSAVHKQQDPSEYFQALERELLEIRRRKMRRVRKEEAKRGE